MIALEEDVQTMFETDELKSGGTIADNLGLALHRCSNERKSEFLIRLNTIISNRRVDYDDLEECEIQTKLATTAFELHRHNADKYLLDDTIATKTAIYDYLSFLFYERYGDLDELMNAVMQFKKAGNEK